MWVSIPHPLYGLVNSKSIILTDIGLGSKHLLIIECRFQTSTLILDIGSLNIEKVLESPHGTVAELFSLLQKAMRN